MDSALKQLTLKNWPSIERLSKKGHVESQYLMGVAYLAGGPVNIDIAKSYSWFVKAAENGHGEAAFRAGMLLSEYDWPNKPDLKPVEMYIRSSSLACPAGMTALGNIWTFNKLSTQSLYDVVVDMIKIDVEAVKAFDLYKKAVELKYAPAFYFAGIHLLKGWGCKKSVDNALSMFKQGAELEDKDCMYSVFKLLHKRKLYSEAIEYVIKASDLGHSDAQAQYAFLILDGKVPNVSDQQAISWLRRAAMQQHGAAAERLGYLYFSGRGVTKNYKEAYKWAMRANTLGRNTKGLLAKSWNNLDDADKVYFLSPEFNKDYSEFFKMSNKLFGKAGFQV